MIGKKKADLQDVLQIFGEYIKAEIFKFRIGKIQNFNPETQKAIIELVVKPFKEYETKQIKELEPVLLFDVPLVFNVGGFGYITTPIHAGDYVSVFFTDTDHTDWVLTGEVRKSAIINKHDKNFCFFIPMSPLPNLEKINDYNNNAIRLKNVNAGEIKLENNTILMQNNADNKMKISASKIEINHNGGGKIEVDGKINIANAGNDLKNILTTFANALLNAQALDPISGPLPLDPVTQSAINTFISDIGSLLK
jgi:hypothetical protein